MTRASNQDGPGFDQAQNAEQRRGRLRRQTDSPVAHERSRVASDAAEQLAPGDRMLDEVLSKLADDASPEVRKSVAGALSRVMKRASGFTRVQMLADWVGRASALQRLAVARALRRRPTLVGAPSALETLAGDTNSDVRRAAVRAAAQRPLWFRRVLRRVARRVAAADHR